MLRENYSLETGCNVTATIIIVDGHLSLEPVCYFVLLRLAEGEVLFWVSPKLSCYRKTFGENIRESWREESCKEFALLDTDSAA